ncbi:MAG: radical SAM protein, partial [Candidatus Methylomirabilis sp.]|nr:radical SAM protein [Deltaproteobacteria bacterium]
IAPDAAGGVVSRRGAEIVDGGRNEPIPDLDANARPAWELFNLPRYKAPPWLSLADAIIPLQASRGCPYACNFCSQNYMQGKLRIRSNEAVLDEIAWLSDSLGVRYVGFADAIFPLSREQGFDFCRRMIERGLHDRVKWLTETRVDLVDPELLEAMHEAGCRTILYGFEVGNQKILAATGKGALIEQARSAMRWTRRARIRTLGLFMLGLPGETVETCRETIRFAAELSPDFAKFNRAVPLPGSPLFDELRQTLPLKEAYERFSSWHPSDGSDLLFVPEGMTGAELVAVQREAVRRFYLRPRAVWQHLTSGTVGPRALWQGARVLGGVIREAAAARMRGGEGRRAPPPVPDAKEAA